MDSEKIPNIRGIWFGKYPIQPVHIRDVARVSIELGASDENITRDIAGPERFTYREFVSLIGKSMGVRRLIIPIPPIIGWLAGQLMGIFLRDRVITRAEIRGLMNGLVASEEEPLGDIAFSQWIAKTAQIWVENTRTICKKEGIPNNPNKYAVETIPQR